jgi:hypothetical protein
MRPPVIVASPVSAIVTRHGSASVPWVVISFVRRSNVMSDECRKWSAK